MSNHVFIASSLDGFIAAPGDSLDWLEEIPNPGHSDYGFAAFMDKIDALVMGRRTFEKVLTFSEWPYPKPVFVLSQSLKALPPTLKGKASLLNGDPHRIVQELAARGYHDLYIDGGQVIQTFLREDLVDVLTITWVPVLLGDGVPLFGTLGVKRKFILESSESFNQQLIKCVYKRVREV
mgnify:FL=1|jgi:dihydrofolate reductase